MRESIVAQPMHRDPLGGRLKVSGDFETFQKHSRFINQYYQLIDVEEIFYKYNISKQKIEAKIKA